MKLLIIRHADPNYEIDGLTEEGKREADLLTERLVAEKPDYFYCSTMNRAYLTVKPTLEKLGLEAERCEWLREFGYAAVKFPEYDSTWGPWDAYPAFMEKNPDLYDPNRWYDNPIFEGAETKKHYLGVVRELDALLEKHGYRRDGYNYSVEHENHDTVALVCHFGVSGVLLSRLMNCSPYSVWQHGVMLPSSVTVLHTEERERGIASFRMCEYGSLSHLYKAGVEPSFAARFCECFSDETRH